MEELRYITQKLALGTAQFGMHYGISNTEGKTPEVEIESILAYCRKNNISFIDTAYAYGVSEQELGKFNLSTFNVITKFLPKEDTNLSIKQQIDVSLKRLGVNLLYGALAHRPLDILKHPTKWKLLNEYKESGLITKIGFSFSTPEELDQVIDAKIIPDLIQIPLNYFDDRFITKATFFKEHFNTEIHTRSTFLQGLFFLSASKLPPFFKEAKKDIASIQRVSNIGSSLLKYIISNYPQVDKVVIGANNFNQLRDNIENIPLSTDLPKQLNRFSTSILNPSKWPTIN